MAEIQSRTLGPHSQTRGRGWSRGHVYGLSRKSRDRSCVTPPGSPGHSLQQPFPSPTTAWVCFCCFEMDDPGRDESFDESEHLTTRHPSKTSHLTPKPSRTGRPNRLDHAPAPVQVYEDVEASSLPVPIPYYSHAPAYEASSPVIKAGLLSSGNPITVSPGPPPPTLINFNEPVSLTADMLVSSTSAEASEPSYYSPTHTHVRNSSHTVVAIVLSILGGSFLLVAFFIVARLRSRRNGRRYLRTPSLPIPQDTFSDPQPDESPIFGGKERFSVVTTGKEKWIWTQYRSKSPLREPEKDPFSDSLAKPHPSSNTLHPNEPSTKKPGFLQRSLSHISALSVYSTAKSDVVGLVANASAPGFDSTSTITESVIADGQSNKSEGFRTSLRQSRDKHTIRITVRDWDASSADEYIYDGVEDPPVVITNIPSTQAIGRERVKAPYPVGSCPSVSVSMNSISPPGITPSNSTTAVGPDSFDGHSSHVAERRMSKTATRRERDTQALTVALGLESPKPGPQARTVPGRGRTSMLRRSHTLAHHSSFVPAAEGPNSPCPSDDGLRLGKFMLRDYRRSSLSLPRDQVPPLPPPVAPLNLRFHGNPDLHKATALDDRPPRVPSPPALPSLAQMAMAQAADYEAYRSPTYSLYDAYADRTTDRERDRRTTLFLGGKDRG